MRAATGQETKRGIARVLGVTHPTITRWIQGGLPPGMMLEITVRFGMDPVEAAVVWGILQDDDVPRLNYAAIARYVPVEILAAELARRASVYAETRPDTERKVRIGMLRIVE